MISRRNFMKVTAGGAVLAGSGIWLPRTGVAAPEAAPLGFPTPPAGAVASAVLEALPGKKPLIKRSFRPPNYETPVEYLNQMFTPNEVFFVRYHVSNIPPVDAPSWRLRIGGQGAQKPFELSLNQLRQDFEQVELPAVCMCAGNRRGWFRPPVAGVEWSGGAMGNAVWRGVRLRDVLDKAGVAKEAIEVMFDGVDSGVVAKTPDFIKSIPIWKALDEDTIIATEMNGAPLPHWNGFPARVVVPGWAATYWVKNLTSISVLTAPEQNFWMKTAYRIPKGKFPVVDRFLTQETETNTPITEMVVNSMITNLEDGQKFPAGKPVEIRGIAWDGGYGINQVLVSPDDGKTWALAELGRDYGKYSWRQWTYRFKPPRSGKHIIAAKASNRLGQTQTHELIQNPAGYHYNVVLRIPITVA